MITSMNHLTLAVTPMERAFIFYKTIMGFTPLCKSDGSAYFLAGSPQDPGCVWVCLDLDRNHQRAPSPCSTHFSFSVSQENFDPMSARILASGAHLYRPNTSPGASLYFLNPDDHKLEIHVGDWASRLAFKKENPGSWTNVEWFI